MSHEEHPTSDDNSAGDGTSPYSMSDRWIFGEECRASDRAREAGEATFWATDDDRWWEAWRNKDMAEAEVLRAEADRLELRRTPPMNRQRLIDGKWVPVTDETELAVWSEGLTSLASRLRADADWLEAKGGRR